MRRRIGLYLCAKLARSRRVVTLARIVTSFHDNDSNPDIHKNGEYNFLKFIANRSHHEELVIDVGCNRGDYALAMCEAGVKGKLVVIDPLEKNTSSTRSKLQQAGRSDVIVETAAVSQTEGSATFFTNLDDALSVMDSLFDMREIGYTDSVQEIVVPVITLSSLVNSLGNPFISFVKIDVEGNELNVLRGGEELFKAKQVAYCQFEFGHAARASRTYLHDLVAFFSQYQYELFVVKPTGLAPLNFNPWTENRYSYGNFVAVNPIS